MSTSPIQELLETPQEFRPFVWLLGANPRLSPRSAGVVLKKKRSGYLVFVSEIAALRHLVAIGVHGKPVQKDLEWAIDQALADRMDLILVGENLVECDRWEYTP